MRHRRGVPFDGAGFGTVMRKFVGNLAPLGAYPEPRPACGESPSGSWLECARPEVQDPDHHFAISQLNAAMRSRNGFNTLSLSSISRMRASAAASFCLSVAISAAATAARSAMIAFVSRGRADRALPPFGSAKIFDDKAVIPSRHCRARAAVSRQGESLLAAAAACPAQRGGFCCRDFPAQRGGF